MKVLPNIEIIGLALYVDSTLIIADVHIGYEEVLNKQGVLVPRLQFEDMIKSLESIFAKLKKERIERIIINGDLKHEFGLISEQEWRNTLKFLDILARHCDEIILIRGNHDAILGPIARKRNVNVLEYYIIDCNMNKSNNELRINDNTLKIKKNQKNNTSKTLVIHGNRIPEKKILDQVDTIIIGHEHPAISLREGPRIESYKCFLKGKYKRKNLIAQPSFNPVIEGTDVLRDEILSPFLRQNLDNFDVYAVEDKAYNFGKLGKLRKN